MKNDKKKYTFKDWLNGNSIDWMQTYLIQDEEFTPEQMEVRNTIKSAQKEAWNWLVELNTEYWFNKLKHESDGYIETFERQKEKFFNDNLDLVLRYKKGHFEGMDHKMYKKLKTLYGKHHENGGCIIGVTIQKNGKGHPSRLQDVYVFKKSLEALKG